MKKDPFEGRRYGLVIEFGCGDTAYGMHIKDKGNYVLYDDAIANHKELQKQLNDSAKGRGEMKKLFIEKPLTFEDLCLGNYIFAESQESPVAWIEKVLHELPGNKEDIRFDISYEYGVQHLKVITKGKRYLAFKAEGSALLYIMNKVRKHAIRLPSGAVAQEVKEFVAEEEEGKKQQPQRKNNEKD